MILSYQVNARTELAVRYNDISPLENHHCAIAFQILAKVSWLPCTHCRAAACPAAVAQGRQPWALPGSCCGKAGSPARPCRAAAVACDWHLHSRLTSGSVPSLSAQPECNIFAYVSAEDFKRIRTVSSLACRHTVSLAYVSHSLTSTHGAYRELLSYYTWPQNYWMYIVT